MRESAKLGIARQLRRDGTLAEHRLWEQLRNRKLAGSKFLRQAPIGPFVADFLCREAKLVIEVDGATHSTQAELESDARRTNYLRRYGHRVIRFQNDEVLNGMDQVLSSIEQALTKLPSPTPLRRNGAPSSPVNGRGRYRPSYPLPPAGEEGDPARSDGEGEGVTEKKKKP